MDMAEATKELEGKTTVLSATVSKPAVSCSSLGGKKYQIAVQAGAVIPGYTLIAYKVTTTQAGAFSELNGATDILGVSTTTEVYLDAIEKVTSSNVLNQADIVSFKTVSKVNFLLTGSAAFAVSAVGIYEITTQLKQLLPLGSEVSGADLRLKEAVWPATQTWPAGTGSTAPTDASKRQTLVYGPADKVFADAGYNAYVPAVPPSTNYVVATSKSILDGDKQSAAATTESIVPVADITDAGWTPLPAAEFVSASGANATYKMSMAKFAIGGVTENGVACSYATHTAKHSILKKNKYSEYEEIRLFYGSDLDQARVSAQFDVPCGQRSLVGVQVSLYNQLGKLIAQSPIVDVAEALIPSGDGAYSGLTVMSHGDQGAVAYPAANTEGADFKWVLNRDATGFAADKCKVRIAFETSTREVTAVVNNVSTTTTTHYPTKDAHMNDPEFRDANWFKDTRIYKLNENGEEIKTKNLALTPVHKEFAELGKPVRGFNVYTLDEDLNAMESYSFKVHRDWKKLISGSVANNNAVYEKLTDTKPITVTITPTIAVQKPLVAYVASDGALTSSFEKDTAATEVNQAAQLKAINIQGGILNAVLVKKGDKYEQIDQSSSANFTSAIENGTYTIASRAQYLSPNFGKPYSADTQYVMSAQTLDSSAKFGPGPAQLDASVVSAIDTHVLTNASNHGCLFTWPELASKCTVIIRAVFNDPTDANADAYAELASGLMGTQKFIKHADILASANLGITAAQYYKHGVEFLVVQEHVDDSVTPSIVTYSQPKALFHMPKGVTTFVAGDFDVVSGPSQLTIKYNKTLDTEVYPDFAGHSIVPATITYAGDNVTREIKVADITSANGIVISGLSDLHNYTISIAIDGQVGADGKPTAIALGGANVTFSPAALPNAVVNLKVETVVVSTGVTAAQAAEKLKVIFAASPSSKNGAYTAAPTNKAYVYSTLSNGDKQYVTNTAGATSADRAAIKERVAQVGTAASGSTPASSDYAPAYDRAYSSFLTGTVLSGLTTGTLYHVEIESTFTLAGHSDQLVSAFASNTASCAPTIIDFRFDSKNSVANLIVDLNGAKLNTLLLLGNNGSVANINLANAAVAQSEAIRNGTNVNLNIAVPAGSTNVAVIVANSQGVALKRRPERPGCRCHREG